MLLVDLFLRTQAAVYFHSLLNRGRVAALAEALREESWLSGLLTELGFHNTAHETLLVLEDNQSTLHLAISHAKFNRTKHVDLRNYCGRQEYYSGHVDIHYVPADLQIADGLTKTLEAARRQQFISLLRLSSTQYNDHHSE